MKKLSENSIDISTYINESIEVSALFRQPFVPFLS